MRVLAAAGIAAPILFTVVVIAQGLFHPDYCHVALPISALAAWPGGWVQNVNFIVVGSLMSVFAIGLHRAMQPARGGIVGPAILLAGGLGLVAAGIFPWRNVEGKLVESAGHVAGSIVAFLGAAVGLMVVSRRMHHDGQWQNLAAFSLAGGIAVLTLFAVFVGLALPPNAPLHPVLGVVQRVTVAAWFTVTIVLAVRMLRVASTRGEQFDAAK